MGIGKVAEGRCEKRPNFMSGACAWCVCCGYLRKFEQGDNTISTGIMKETNVVQAVVWAEAHSQAKSRTEQKWLKEQDCGEW